MKQPEEHGLTPATVQSYLDEQLTYKHEEHQHSSNTQAVIDKQHELITAAVRKESQSRKIHFLDIGCGWGDFSGKLDAYLTSYVGVEPSTTELKEFTRRPGRHLVHGVGENLSFLRTHSRNVILLNSVLDHCVDWKKTFDNCMRVLSPGGLMIISMENGQKLAVSIRKALHIDASHEGHLAFFTYDGINELLEKEGLSVESKCTMGYLYGFHQLTRVIPVPKGIMRPANRLVDCVLRPALPNRGQILFFAARNNRAALGPVTHEEPFQCHACAANWTFGTARCAACGASMPYLEGDTLDAMVFTDTEKIIHEKLSHPA